MGSVKDLTVLTPATAGHTGEGYFTFSDRYSVFDWGEMPDHIPAKGIALNMMAAFNFIQLRKRGVLTHFLGTSKEASGVTDFNKPSNIMRVKLTQVIPTDRDYARYDGSQKHYLIPLEIIFRNGLPKGSSIFKKLKRSEDDAAATASILAELGLKEKPQPGMMLPEARYDFTTKLESTDRALSFTEAKRISGLNDTQFIKLLNTAKNVNQFITAQAESKGFKHFDGKIEAMICDGEIILVDVLGTFDENRFLYHEEQISKEILRQAYVTLQPDFIQAIDQAKLQAAAEHNSDWKSYCSVKPEKLPDHFIEIISQIYQSGANHYTGEIIFPHVPSLDTLIPELIRLKSSLK